MRTRTALLCLLLSPLSGCCSLARLFCGPDTTPWVQIDYSTPEAAVRTLLEAIRRDQPQIVYDALSERYRKAKGIDHQVAELAWQRIREQNPGLHVAGYASVGAPTRRSADSASFLLDVEGRHLAIDVVRESFWEITWVTDKGVPRRQGATLGHWNEGLAVRPVEDPERFLSKLELAPIQFEHEGEEAVPVDRIDGLRRAHRWKIANLDLVQP